MAIVRVLSSLLCVLMISIPKYAQGIEVGGWEGFSAHRIAGTITFPNPNTLLIEGFSYDGGGVAVFLYYYPVGQSIDGRSGIILPAPGGGTRGRLDTRSYNNEDLVVNLPTGVTACDMGALTVWCEPFFATFSRVNIPRSIFTNASASGGECQLVGGNEVIPEPPVTEFDNCIPFSPSLQVSWTVNTNKSRMDFMMCSCRPLDQNINQYMGFGLSGSNSSTFMVGADATIAWVDNLEGTPNAEDYHLSGRFQCRAGEGACPDIMRTAGTCTNDVTSVTGGIRNGNQQCVTFARPIATNDSVCDTDFTPNMQQYIVWAIGGLGQTAFIHFSRANPTAPPIQLGRTPLDECSADLMCARCPPFSGQRMELRSNTILRMTIGPSAGERGYMAITGQVGWGISWYVNGTLIPELVVQRNVTYTFIVEGGIEDNGISRYHPLYITDSNNGGRLQNTMEEQARETVYAGFNESGDPIGAGRLCEYTESQTASTIRETCNNGVEDYLREVTSEEPTCETGTSASFTWTPDENTPNEVYYQCGTHLNLGWRIIVMSAVDETMSTISTTDDTTQSVSNVSTTSTIDGAVPTVSIISLSSLILMILMILVLV